MQIVDLDERDERSYFVCLEDWSDEMAEAGDHKARWYDKMRDRGLRVKLAIDGDGEAIGMIQYLPIEQSPATGTNLYMILCIWVHGHKKGVGNRQGRGAGEALLAAAEEDSRTLGAEGIAAWGMTLPMWMKAGWFKKHGYRSADRDGLRTLVWKPFTAEAAAPRWIMSGPKPPRIEGKVAVTAYLNGWCPASNIVHERARRACAEFGDEVVFESIDTSEQAAMLACGQSDCVFIDGTRAQKGPPPSYDHIRKMIGKRVARLGVR